MEKEREQLQGQQKLFQTFRPSVIPHMVIPLDRQQDTVLPDDHTGNGSVFVNEAAYSSGGFNNRHYKGTDQSAHNCLNSLLAHPSGRRQPASKTVPLDQHNRSLLDTTGELVRVEDVHADHRSLIRETWTCQASGPGSVLPQPEPDPNVSMETDSGGEEGREETIVYL